MTTYFYRAQTGRTIHFQSISKFLKWKKELAKKRRKNLWASSTENYIESMVEFNEGFNNNPLTIENSFGHTQTLERTPHE